MIEQSIHDVFCFKRRKLQKMDRLKWPSRTSGPDGSLCRLATTTISGGRVRQRVVYFVVMKMASARTRVSSLLPVLLAVIMMLIQSGQQASASALDQNGTSGLFAVFRLEQTPKVRGIKQFITVVSTSVAQL